MLASGIAAISWRVNPRQLLLWVFHTSKSQVSRTLLGILANLNITVVRMVSTSALISDIPGPFTNSLVTVPTAMITVGINITFMFHSFSVLLQCPGSHLFFRFISILLCGPTKQQSPLFGKFFFSFLLTIVRSGRVPEIKWSVCLSKS